MFEDRTARVAGLEAQGWHAVAAPPSRPCPSGAKGPADGVIGGWLWAAEERPGYDAEGSSGEPQVEPIPDAEEELAAAVALVSAGLDRLLAVDLAGVGGDKLLAAGPAVKALVSRAEAAQVALVGTIDTAGAYLGVGSATAGSWWVHHTNSDFGAARSLANAAKELRGLPVLAAAFAAGQVSFAHVRAVTDAVTSDRAAGVAALDDTLSAQVGEAGSASG